MTLHLFISSCLLFCTLFVAGTLICLPLFKRNWHNFFASSLWTKITWWIPIFIWLQAVLLGGVWFAIITVAIVSILAAGELRRAPQDRFDAKVYAVGVCLFFASLILFWSLNDRQTVVWLYAICFSSALSDIFAFFGGKFLGNHRLPTFLNPGKAWEGVVGQVVGGAIGWLLVVGTLGLGLAWWPGLLIGIASAVGDLTNSLIKRRLGITDWGTTIPGHGGVLDRFSSLSVALLVGLLLAG